mgnify:CR=1 FL=1
MAWAQIVLGAYQAAVSYTDKKDAQLKQDRLANIRNNTTYQTPIELYKQSNAYENMAQSGFAPEELTYLTTQSNQALQNSLYTSEVLGGDPNDLSFLYNQHMNDIMRIEGADHAQRMENFSKYINSLGTIADSKTAEWVSKDNILKDQLQAAQAGRTEAAKSEQSGINAALAGLSAVYSDSLYKDEQSQNELKPFTSAYGDQGKNAYAYAKKNNLSFNEYDKKLRTNLSLVRI